MAGWIPWVVIVVLAGLCALYLRGERTSACRRGAEIMVALGHLVEEVGALRAALVASGAVERPAKPPGPPLAAPPDATPVTSRTIPAPLESEPPPASCSARPAAPPPMEATLASAVSPVAVWIAQATTQPGNADGETMLRRDGDRLAALPRTNADDDPEDGRDTGEDMTRVFGKAPRGADTQIPDVELRALPPTVRPPPHRPPRPIVDPLADVPLERPTSSATRTAEAFHTRVTRPGGVTTTPGDERNGEP